jgi:hypothetical protein
MNLAESEEAVAVPAIFDEGGLEAGFDPRDPREINVSAEGLTGGVLEVEVLDLATLGDGNARLLLVVSVDEHGFGH